MQWPLKKSRSQHEGILKLRHMPKSPDPSSTFPHVQMPSQFFIVRLRPTPTSPASTPGKFFFLFCCLTFAYLRCPTPSFRVPPSYHVPPSYRIPTPSCCVPLSCRVPLMLCPSIVPHPSVVPHPHSLVLYPFLVPLSCRVTPLCHIPSSCRVPVSCHVTPSCHVPVSYGLPTPSYRAPTLTRCTLRQPPTPRCILAA